MNPFEDTLPDNRLKNNSRSIHYGRYRLNFDQIYPFREPLYSRLSLKTKDIELASMVYDLFPTHIHRLIHFDRPEDDQGNVITPKGEEDSFFLLFEMLSDFIYIDLKDLYVAIAELAFVLEDCRFIIYSSGDENTRWLDEYSITNGVLSFSRNFCEDHIFTGRLDYYIERTITNPVDVLFLRFTFYQLYDWLLYWIHRYYQVPHWIDKNLIETVSNMEKVNKTTLDIRIKAYFQKFYSLDEACPDWNSINQKYKLV
ncbi:hypothetical protein QNI16_19625 [Cytophagaceae bacterium YF14B1]|uniref:Uncharacterized protein n=1 Tax=Xanthocytophaga flava TaxID=3048013 RepID=A0AAE3QSK0_9BACT|nr:hypothetical protein [Xanthocytophaga flavus]MDJ1482720.1 hypothetical protein [Xanthocytophaga flavus]